MSGSTVQFFIIRSKSGITVFQKKLDLLSHPWLPVWVDTDAFVNGYTFHAASDIKKHSRCLGPELKTDSSQCFESSPAAVRMLPSARF